MAILLKTASVRVSSIQIMQVRVQNKGKSVWKSRYDGDVSSSDLAPATSHEDPPGGDGFNHHSSRWGVAVGVLQPKVKGTSQRHLGGEELWEADPSAWRHHRPKHEFTRGVHDMDPWGDGVCHRGTATMALVLAAAFVTPPSGALSLGVQGQRIT